MLDNISWNLFLGEVIEWEGVDSSLELSEEGREDTVTVFSVPERPEHIVLLICGDEGGEGGGGDDDDDDGDDEDGYDDRDDIDVDYDDLSIYLYIHLNNTYTIQYVRSDR